MPDIRACISIHRLRNQLTSQYRVFLEKLSVTLSRNSMFLRECIANYRVHKSSLIGHYAEPAKTSPIFPPLQVRNFVSTFRYLGRVKKSAQASRRPFATFHTILVICYGEVAIVHEFITRSGGLYRIECLQLLIRCSYMQLLYTPLSGTSAYSTYI
jgi:hypothetical protein